MASILESHPRRREIDTLLMQGVPTRAVVKQLGLHVSHSAVADYRRKVLIPAIKTARKIISVNDDTQVSPSVSLDLVRATGQVSAASPLVAKLREDEIILDELVAEGRANKDVKGAVSAISTKQRGYRLEAELTGQLEQQSSGGPGVVVNILQLPTSSVHQPGHRELPEATILADLAEPDGQTD